MRLTTEMKYDTKITTLRELPEIEDITTCLIVSKITHNFYDKQLHTNRLLLKILNRIHN